MTLVERLAQKVVDLVENNERRIPNVVADVVANEHLPVKTDEERRRIHELRSFVERRARELIRKG